MEIIKRVMEDIPGILIENEWRNYAENRNDVLDYIQENKQMLSDDDNDPVYALHIDADDVVIGLKPSITEDVGYVLQKSEGLEFNRRLLLNMKLPWRFIGNVHEVPTVGDELESVITSTNVQNIVVQHMADGNSWKDQQKKYEGHVELANKVQNKTPREQFYLAQSLKAAQKYPEAIKAYEDRIQMTNGFNQEVVYSQLQIARIEHTMGKLDKAILDYMKCYEMDPERGEALMELVCMLRQIGKYNLGKMFANELLKTEKMSKENKLFIENTLGPNILLEIGLCAYYTGNKKEAKRLWTKAMRMTPIAENIKTALKENMKFCGERR
jgi:tetratricopeptide (TPR) repeat protein